MIYYTREGQREGRGRVGRRDEGRERERDRGRLEEGKDERLEGREKGGIR
jgi:hypothetical protein